MKPVALWRYLALAAAPIAPLIGLTLQEGWWGAAALVAVTLGWAGGRQRYSWADNAGLLLFMLCLTYAVWLDVAAYWLITGVAGALAAWNLGHFESRLLAQAAAEHEAALWKAHWQALVSALALMMVISGAALVIRIELSFWPAFGLALFVVTALSRLLRSSN
jgi:ABC-type dipeptide/oligopeptide/nickel transport system permease component